ncbi:MAG TPA: glycosyltransferase family 4 protein [Gemmatimonadaceae bacterium]|nr:glycosyltransferase family 4 protein [Gemmatimonadaceae bacterium]
MTALRFCMVTTFYPPHGFGGDALFVQNLARAVARRGHEVTVVCNRDAYAVLHPDGAPPVSDDGADGVVVHRLDSPLGALALLLTQQTGRAAANAPALERIFERGRFDVVHYHNVSLLGGPGAFLYGDGVKLYTAHEHWLVCPTHVLWRFDREPCPARKCLRCTLRAGRPPQLWRRGGVVATNLDEIDAFIAMSEFSRRKHHEFGFPREMEVMPGFLHDEPPEDSGDATPHDRPYFLFAGRLERMKGLDDVIPLFRDYPHADLLIAGDGTHRAALEKIAAGSPRVRFLGRMPHRALGPYYRHALAAIVPTAGYETFGLAVIDALSHGTPVLARRIGPLPELIETSGGGATFATPDELAALLRHVQCDEVARSAMSHAARAGYEAHWSEGVVVPRYLDLVARVADGRGNRRVADALSGAGATA